MGQDGVEQSLAVSIPPAKHQPRQLVVAERPRTGIAGHHAVHSVSAIAKLHVAAQLTGERRQIDVQVLFTKWLFVQVLELLYSLFRG